MHTICTGFPRAYWTPDAVKNNTLFKVENNFKK